MFTGIIKDVGTVTANKRRALEVLTALKCGLGDSVAVNGACLTVSRVYRRVRDAQSRRRRGAAAGNGRLSFDMSDETLRLTNLGDLKSGAPVNLEPSLRAGDPLGGHLVSGHVDARAKILAFKPLPAGFTRLRVEIPQALKGLVALKGSISVDGVSLTVTAVGRGFFETVLVPHTLKSTNLGRRGKGEAVNLEADLLARYVKTALANQ